MLMLVFIYCQADGNQMEISMEKLIPVEDRLIYIGFCFGIFQSGTCLILSIFQISSNMNADSGLTSMLISVDEINTLYEEDQRAQRPKY